MARERMLPDGAAAELPVRAALPEVISSLRSQGCAVLVAAPGSGKTSLLPLALADAFAGRVLVAEPRRIATRAAAARMAWLLGERPGQRIGYAMRGERVRGSRIEVVTTGLLVQRLQRDPELAGVSAIVIDECHERHLDADLLLAFALDVRTVLREDLALVATSATPDTARLAAMLSAPVVDARGALFDVDVVWAPPPRPLPLLADARVDPRLLDHVALVVRRALAGGDGDVLVFVPGEAEIMAVSRRLHDCGPVLPLFGRQSAAEQERALQAGTERRIVVTTSVAESSLTVPGVRIVVDAGLARQPRTDQARGLSALVTTRVSRASADQRAGRAGREGPGTVYRCWSEAEHVHLDEHAPPEIATADLAGFALSLADWGGSQPVLLEDPPAPAWAAAQELLRDLDAVDPAGRITAKGRAMSTVGAHPRLARAVVDGAALVGAARAREVVALLSDDGLTGRADDLPERWRNLRTGRDRAAAARWREEIRRLGAGGPEPTALTDDLVMGVVVGLAYPDRLARARRPGSVSYLMAGGTGAALEASSALRGSEWLAVAVADRPAGRADARVRSAVPIDEATARLVGARLLSTSEEVSWHDGALVTRRIESLGAIVLSESPLTRPDPSLVAAAVREGLHRSGLAVLRWTPAAQQLRQRLAFLHARLGAPWPAVDDAALLEQLELWLGPDLERVRHAGDLARVDVAQALRRLLPWPAATRLDELAPLRVQVPSGSRIALSYDGDQAPVLAVRVQEIFGWTSTPSVADGRVPLVLHLLSPAGRTVAVTSDLASFWRQGYPQVRADLRARYPRHAWPETPA